MYQWCFHRHGIDAARWDHDLGVEPTLVTSWLWFGLATPLNSFLFLYRIMEWSCRHMERGAADVCQHTDLNKHDVVLYTACKSPASKPAWYTPFISSCICCAMLPWCHCKIRHKCAAKHHTVPWGTSVLHHEAQVCCVLQRHKTELIRFGCGVSHASCIKADCTEPEGKLQHRLLCHWFFAVPLRCLVYKTIVSHKWAICFPSWSLMCIESNSGSKIVTKWSSISDTLNIFYGISLGCFGIFDGIPMASLWDCHDVFYDISGFL